MSRVNESHQRGLAARLDALIDGVGLAANWLALAIVLLVATNVLLRYSASIGSVWAQELEWHLLAALILLGMSHALKYSEPIRVDVLYSKYGEQARRALDGLTLVLTIGICILFVYLSLHYVQQAFVINEQSPDPGGLTHRWILKALIPAGFTLVALQNVLALIRLSHSSLSDSAAKHV